jgi:hypothetical protein
MEKKIAFAFLDFHLSRKIIPISIKPFDLKTLDLGILSSTRYHRSSFSRML